MECVIQRQTILLVPPERDDLEWLCAQYDNPSIWQMFGYAGPSSATMRARLGVENILVGIIRRAATRGRIGFVNVFPPKAEQDTWELGFAIPSERDRDGWSALHAADAMAHYMFDHLGFPAVSFRVRKDNRASRAIVRRLGYRRFGGWEINGHEFEFFRVDRRKWDLRHARLQQPRPSAPPQAAFQTFRGSDYSASSG